MTHYFLQTSDSDFRTTLNRNVWKLNPPEVFLRKGCGKRAGSPRALHQPWILVGRVLNPHAVPSYSMGLRTLSKTSAHFQLATIGPRTVCTIMEAASRSSLSASGRFSSTEELKWCSKRSRSGNIAAKTERIGVVSLTISA